MTFIVDNRPLVLQWIREPGWLVPLHADYLRRLEFPPEETTLTARDAILYALSIGLAQDPLDERELPYVLERGLKIFPTMPLIVGPPPGWMSDPRTGITRSRVVHGSQRLWIHSDLPLGRPIVSVNRIADIVDKAEKGAIVILTRETIDKQTRELIARSEMGVFCRADGGFGGAVQAAYEFAAVPHRPPDRRGEVQTTRNAALLYRLNGDMNPLHGDPAVAGKAGFSRPILHGLCTFGAAAVALTRLFGGTICEIEARFSKPVLPGDTISVEAWKDRGRISFRAYASHASAFVLDRGCVRFK